MIHQVAEQSVSLCKIGTCEQLRYMHVANVVNVMNVKSIIVKNDDHYMNINTGIVWKIV